jgi:Neuraminidase (sialidase)
MVVDTELRKNEHSAGSGKPLDVDQFPFGYADKPRDNPKAMEGTLFQCDDGSILFGDFDGKVDGDPSEHFASTRFKRSTDNGKTWSEPWLMSKTDGKSVECHHNTILNLGSGKLGMVYATRDVPKSRVGRDGGTVFATSSDNGQTWSNVSVIEPRFGICCTGHAIVMSTGRIVAPVFKWISYDPTGEAESMISPSVSYAYVYVSDDQGQTWTQSLSELFVSHYRAAYDLEEPAVIELKDGRLLMHMRSQLGRGFRCWSEDGGICWSRPDPLPYAAGYTPHCLKRLPGGELLTIWTQVSRQEILTGFHRHRLSCAISRDDGQTWENFKNLESLDDITQVPAPPAHRHEVIEQWEDYGYYQPSNTQRYHRAPGVLRIGYPDALVLNDDNVLVVYDYGMGVLGDTSGVKQRTIPAQWFLS